MNARRYPAVALRRVLGVVSACCPFTLKRVTLRNRMRLGSDDHNPAGTQFDDAVVAVGLAEWRRSA